MTARVEDARLWRVLQAKVERETSVRRLRKLALYWLYHQMACLAPTDLELRKALEQMEDQESRGWLVPAEGESQAERQPKVGL